MSTGCAGSTQATLVSFMKMVVWRSLIVRRTLWNCNMVNMSPLGRYSFAYIFLESMLASRNSVSMTLIGQNLFPYILYWESASKSDHTIRSCHPASAGYPDSLLAPIKVEVWNFPWILPELCLQFPQLGYSPHKFEYLMSKLWFGVFWTHLGRQVEAVLAGSPYVDSVMLHADPFHSYCVALIVVTQPALEAWAQDSGLVYSTFADLCENSASVVEVLASLSKVSVL